MKESQSKEYLIDDSSLDDIGKLITEANEYKDKLSILIYFFLILCLGLALYMTVYIEITENDIYQPLIKVQTFLLFLILGLFSIKLFQNKSILAIDKFSLDSCYKDLRESIRMAKFSMNKEAVIFWNRVVDDYQLYKNYIFLSSGKQRFGHDTNQDVGEIKRCIKSLAKSINNSKLRVPNDFMHDIKYIQRLVDRVFRVIELQLDIELADKVENDIKLCRKNRITFRPMDEIIPIIISEITTMWGENKLCKRKELKSLLEYSNNSNSLNEIIVGYTEFFSYRLNSDASVVGMWEDFWLVMHNILKNARIHGPHRAKEDRGGAREYMYITLDDTESDYVLANIYNSTKYGPKMNFEKAFDIENSNRFLMRDESEISTGLYTVGQVMRGGLGRKPNIKPVDNTPFELILEVSKVDHTKNGSNSVITSITRIEVDLKQIVNPIKCTDVKLKKNICNLASHADKVSYDALITLPFKVNEISSAKIIESETERSYEIPIFKFVEGENLRDKFNPLLWRWSLSNNGDNQIKFTANDISGVLVEIGFYQSNRKPK